MHLDRPATEKAEQHATKLTKRRLAKPFLALIVPFLFPSTLAAEPSLAETVQYIEAKLSNVPRSSSTWDNDTRTFRLNGGKITSTLTDPRSAREVSTFQLGALSTTVDVESGSDYNSVRKIKISCARGRCISYRRLSYDDGDYDKEVARRMTGGMSFAVHLGDAEKIQKALTHAIKLSGGKDELF